MALAIVITLVCMFFIFWWGEQGVFNGILQLMGVVIAGALAFGMWEKLAFLLLKFPWVRPSAWGISLLLLFFFWFAVYRTIMGRAVKANVNFPQWVNRLAGGWIGFFYGILVCGIVVTGLSFMNFGTRILMYQPLVFEGSSHRPVENEKALESIWVPVDSITIGLFDMLSSGAFHSRYPMRRFQPDLWEQAAHFRLIAQRHASKVAVPGSVELVDDAIYTVSRSGAETEIGYPPLDVSESLASTDKSQFARNEYLVGEYNELKKLIANLDADQDLVAVRTRFKPQPRGTYDADGLRVFPTQVLLVVRTRGYDLYRPIAASTARSETTNNLRELKVFDSNTDYAAGTNLSGEDGDEIVWFFAIPAKREAPEAILIRHTRLRLSGKYYAQPDIFSRLATGYSAEEAQVYSETQVGTGTVVADQTRKTPVGTLDNSDTLPRTTSRNNVSGSVTYSTTNERAVAEGEFSVDLKGSSGAGRGNVVASIHRPTHLRCVRLMLDKDQLIEAIRGVSASGGNDVDSVYVRTLVGDRTQDSSPIAMAGMTQGRMIVRVRPSNPYSSATTIDNETTEYRGDDKLYLYFWVDPGSKVTELKIGKVSHVLSEPFQVPENR